MEKITTERLKWHKADATDLPALTEGEGDYSRELIFLVKEADFGSYYREGYFDRDSLMFYARGAGVRYHLGDITAWAYLPDEDELIKALGHD